MINLAKWFERSAIEERGNHSIILAPRPSMNSLLAKDLQFVK